MKRSEFKARKYRWVDIEKPSSAGMKKLGAEFNIPSFAIEDTLAYTQRPKAEIQGDFLFVILRYPVWKKTRKEISLTEIDLFIKKNLLITVHRGDVKVINKVLAGCKNGTTIGQCYRDEKILFYSILKELMLSFFPMLDMITDDIDEIENRIYKGNERKIVLEISKVRRNIIDLRKIMKPEKQVMTHLGTRFVQRFEGRELLLYFTDLTDYAEQIWQVLETQKETISALQETNESLISYQTTEVMKILTIISVVLLPMGVIAGIYGMNIALPLRTFPGVFYILLGVMAVIVLAMLLYFKRRSWY